MKYVDLLVSVLFVIAVVVLYFLWGCHMDLYVTIAAVILFAVALWNTFRQYKKIKELSKEKEK